MCTNLKTVEQELCKNRGDIEQVERKLDVLLELLLFLMENSDSMDNIEIKNIMIMRLKEIKKL